MLICVGIPVYDGKPYAQLVDSLLAEQFVCSGQGVHIFPIWVSGVALIGHARNMIAKTFLDLKKSSVLVSVDADISWKAGDILRLARRPEDVIGATYRTKREAEFYHVFGDVERVNDVWRVGGIPGGFAKVTRSAFEAMTPHAGQYRDADDNVFHDFYPTGMKDGILYGEDYGFCRLWRQAGGDVWLDSSVRVRHHDGAQVFTGDPTPFLEKRANA